MADAQAHAKTDTLADADDHLAANAQVALAVRDKPRICRRLTRRRYRRGTDPTGKPSLDPVIPSLDSGIPSLDTTALQTTTLEPATPEPTALTSEVPTRLTIFF